MSIWERHPEAVDILRTMIAQGQTTSMIARFLTQSLHCKVTRNAVIGKALRLGLRTNAPQRVVVSAPKARRQRPKVKPVARVKKPREAAKPEPMPKAREIVRANPVPFLDRAHNQCSFPISGEGASMICCGNAVTRGHIFCAECSTFAVVKIKGAA